uniref:Putative site-specific DNA endonuclease n=1 Tax=Uronema confervicola TaxID=764120 RepID=A0A6H1U6B6_9CHLO|nr:putative site-specific DNA endonuclease [Uronema confervicola]QIZ74195.1 putative site-specific DNA endonuclease [Uronema confervicola]
MKHLTEIEKAYIAGFLDGDGSINVQIVRRKDYILKFQIRFTITFFQKTTRYWFLVFLQKKLKTGTLKKRNDGVSELCLVGWQTVKLFLLAFKPYIRLKRRQAVLLLKIIDKLPQSKDPQSFLNLCELVDQIAFLNDSKKRIIDSAVVRSELGLDNYFKSP